MGNSISELYLNDPNNVFDSIDSDDELLNNSNNEKELVNFAIQTEDTNLCDCDNFSELKNKIEKLEDHIKNLELRLLKLEDKHIKVINL